MRLLPTLRRVAAVLLIALTAVCLLIQVNQRLLRHRAERLHAEVVALQIHPGTFADIQRLEREWGRFAHYDGVCTREHCKYQIVIADSLTAFAYPGGHDSRPWILQIYPKLTSSLEKVGFHPAFLQAEFRVHNDRMWGEDLEISIPDSMMIVSMKAGPRVLTDGNYSAAALRRGYDLPGYACTGCQGLWIHLNTNAPASDILRLNGIRWDCFTRWRSCADRDDLIPGFTREHEAEQREREAEWKKGWDDCSPPLERQAQEAGNIILVESVAAPSLTTDMVRSSLSYRLRVLDRLKNAETVATGQILNIAIASDETKGSPPSISELKRQERYLFFYPSRHSPYEPEVSAESCSFFSLNDAALEAVKRGVARDTSTGEPYPR